MTLAINLFIHVLLVGSILAFLAFTIADAVAEPNRGERTKRFMLMAAGGLIALGANQAGVGYADFTVGALATARGPSAVAAIVSAAIPALLGVGLGFLIARLMKNDDPRAARLVGFVAVLASVAFALVYAQATQTRGVILGVAALPNLSFVVGVMLTYGFASDDQSRDAGGLAGMARSLWRSRRSPESSAADETIRIVRKDDFDDLR